MADKAANSIRLLVALRHTSLAQTIDDALKLLVKDLVVGPLDPGICLNGEAGVDLLDLCRRLSRLFVIAGVSVCPREIGERPPRWFPRDRLFAPFDRLIPLREMIVGDCHENLASAEGKSEELGLNSSRGRCPPVPEGFASEGAERVAGNKMALDVEGVLDGGVNGQEPLR